MLLVHLDPKERPPRPEARRTEDEDGSVATEYGLILLLVVLAMILAVTVFGITVAGMFDRGVEPF